MWNLVSTAGVVRHPCQVLTISAKFAKRHEVWCCLYERQHPSDWLIPNAFHWLLPLIGPSGNGNCLNSNFAKIACNTQCPSNNTKYIASPLDANKDLAWQTVAHLIFHKMFFLHILVNHPFFIGLNSLHTHKRKGGLYFAVWKCST